MWSRRTATQTPKPLVPQQGRQDAPVGMAPLGNREGVANYLSDAPIC